MAFGIIAEGRSDIAVIINILKGVLHIDRSEITDYYPQLEYDETDLGQMPPEAFSNWTLVKQQCIERNFINTFLDNPFDENPIVIIQIDTAECEETGYDVVRPLKNSEEYSKELRSNVVQKIKEWLKSDDSSIVYAICIEETEAWLMTVYSRSNDDTCKHNNVKEKLLKLLNRPGILPKKNQRKILSMKDTFGQYDLLSKEFRKPKKLNQFRRKNESLNAFCCSLELLNTST